MNAETIRMITTDVQVLVARRNELNRKAKSGFLRRHEAVELQNIKNEIRRRNCLTI